MSLKDVKARMDEITAQMVRTKMKIQCVHDKLSGIEPYLTHVLLYEGGNSDSDMEFSALMQNKVGLWETYKGKVAKFHSLEKEYRVEANKFQKLLLEVNKASGASSVSTVKQEESCASILKQEVKECGKGWKFLLKEGDLQERKSQIFIFILCKNENKDLHYRVKYIDISSLRLNMKRSALTICRNVGVLSLSGMNLIYLTLTRKTKMDIETLHSEIMQLKHLNMK